MTATCVGLGFSNEGHSTHQWRQEKERSELQLSPRNKVSLVHALSIRTSQLDQRNRLYTLFGFRVLHASGLRDRAQGSKPSNFVPKTVAFVTAGHSPEEEWRSVN